MSPGLALPVCKSSSYPHSLMAPAKGRGLGELSGQDSGGVIRRHHDVTVLRHCRCAMKWSRSLSRLILL